MVQVKIGNCTINGLHKKNIDVFLGIPYAKPFNKISRFQHSKFMELSKPMIDATHIQSIPPQPYNSLEDFSMTDSSFNSLNKMIIACFKYLETIVQSKSFTCSDLLLWW